MDNPIALMPLFFMTAVLYAGAGFGGGSTYLALLVLSGLAYRDIPLLALVCNLIVVSGSTLRFYRSGHLHLRRILPFILASVPLAYIGGRLPIDKTTFLVLLGVSLAAAGFRLVLLDTSARATGEHQRDIPPYASAGIGAGIGLLSGIVGIGGGIFLSPLLYCIRWGHARQIAATSSLFILVNSASGLLGQLQKTGGFDHGMWAIGLGLAVLAGGQIGNLFALNILSLRNLQRLTGGLVTLAAAQIFIRLFGG